MKLKIDTPFSGGDQIQIRMSSTNKNRKTTEISKKKTLRDFIIYLFIDNDTVQSSVPSERTRP
jgi:hypothetical protein